MGCLMKTPPTFDELTPEARAPYTDDVLPATVVDPTPKANSAAARRKHERTRLRESFREAWQTSGGTQLALERAAFAVRCEPEQIPVEARESLQSLTAWVFAMRGLMGSTQHFKEIGDRVDPKPKRIEIEGAIGVRRITAGGSRDPEEANAANAYYAFLAGGVVDAEFANDDEMDFLK